MLDYKANLFEINNLYNDVDGMSSSLKGRKNFTYDRLGDLTYGELVASELEFIFSKMNLTSDMHFVDLGSGIGKITLCASLLFPFLSSTGIEIVPSLHEIAINKYKRFKLKFNDTFDIKFLNKSFFDFDFNGKYCLFTNSLCFSEDTCDLIAKSFSNSSHGSYLFSTKELSVNSDITKVECLKNVLVSWGENLIYIYKK